MLTAIPARAALAAVAALLAAAPVAAQEPPLRVNPDAALSVEFTRRVADYLELHRKAAAGRPQLSREATPEEIERHQHDVARAIQQMRPRAQQGEVFTRDIRAYFRRQLAGVFAGPEGLKLKAAIMDENPGPIKIRINGRYPDTVPLATMPAQVLAALPKLPAGVEYRFLGERLILLDVPAHLIVDLIPDALPR
jgi:predicted DNA-binding protein (UPF0251 family)